MSKDEKLTKSQSVEEESLPEGVDVPNHIAIIPDGNRRWARARDLPTYEGHRRGFKIAPEIFKTARRFGVHTVTAWAFSTENWNRSEEEVGYLMELYEQFIDRNLEDAKKQDVRICHLGRKDRINDALREKIEEAVEETRENESYVLNVALDYGGHDELLRSTIKAIEQVQVGEMDVGQLKEVIGRYAGKYPYYGFKNLLDTQDQPYPYPDLVIRTSGEQRTSGLLTWQIAYAEFYWERDHFPDFNSRKLKEAIIDYSRRRRRFGGADVMVPQVSFDPQKAARFETNWWRAHHEGRVEEMRSNFMKLTSEVFGVDKKVAEETLESFTKAVAEGYNERNWQAAAEEMAKFYKLIRDNTQMDFIPSRAAELEVNWWQIHNQLKSVVDKSKLEEAFISLYGELYQQSVFQLREACHYRAMATFEHDLAEGEKISKENSQRHWREAEKYLEQFYRSLRELVA